jgi:hypothetical protein
MANKVEEAAQTGKKAGEDGFDFTKDNVKKGADAGEKLGGDAVDGAKEVGGDAVDAGKGATEAVGDAGKNAGDAVA